MNVTVREEGRKGAYQTEIRTQAGILLRKIVLSRQPVTARLSIDLLKRNKPKSTFLNLYVWYHGYNSWIFHSNIPYGWSVYLSVCLSR